MLEAPGVVWARVTGRGSRDSRSSRRSRGRQPSRLRPSRPSGRMLPRAGQVSRVRSREPERGGRRAEGDYGVSTVDSGDSAARHRERGTQSQHLATGEQSASIPRRAAARGWYGPPGPSPEGARVGWAGLPRVCSLACHRRLPSAAASFPHTHSSGGPDPSFSDPFPPPSLTLQKRGPGVLLP